MDKLLSRLVEWIRLFVHVYYRSAPWFYKTIKGKSKTKNPKIIGLIRERNESLILQDSLDHLSRFVDGIIVFDDASTDDSVNIARNHPAVVEVIINKRWRKNRTWEETANRHKLHQRGKAYNPQWFFYADADERFEGNIRAFLEKNQNTKLEGIRISLFDAYMTPQDKQPYRTDKHLLNFRKMFGPERRDILMIWRNNGKASYVLPDSREPTGLDENHVITKFYCQHYGKSLSVKHWEETCQYYVDNFPQYREKWQARKGCAVHEKSDFGAKLYTWDKVKTKSIKIN